MFTNEEKYDMLRCFIECDRNYRHAEELYLNRYPERRQPNKNMFPKLESNLKNFGSFVKPRAKHYNKPEREINEINVIGYITANPKCSLEEVKTAVGVSKSQAGKILKKYKYKPYKFKKIHDLHPGDEVRRIQFCNWYIENCEADPNFHLRIMWTDEAKVTNCGIFNRHNNRYWSAENTHVTIPIQHQGRFGINIWCGIFGHQIVGPFFYENNLTSQLYNQILREVVGPFIENIPLGNLNTIYYQQDGAPAHNALIVRNYLDTEFPNRWLGTHGPIPWPPRSPDLTPPDFFLWGFLKNEIYQRQHENLEELQESIRAAFRKISRIHLINTLRSVKKRCELCRNLNGFQFEHMLN